MGLGKEQRSLRWGWRWEGEHSAEGEDWELTRGTQTGGGGLGRYQVPDSLEGRHLSILRDGGSDSGRRGRKPQGPEFRAVRKCLLVYFGNSLYYSI